MSLLYSRTSKAQSLDQGYPRKTVAEVRADPPPTPKAAARWCIAASPCSIKEISRPLQEDFKTRNPKPSSPALS